MKITTDPVTSATLIHLENSDDRRMMMRIMALDTTVPGLLRNNKALDADGEAALSAFMGKVHGQLSL